MIGFQFQKANLRGLLVVAISLLMSACAQPYFKREPQSPPAVPATPEATLDIEQPVPRDTGPAERLSSELLYSVLLGEIAGQRGALEVSGASYMEAAASSRDPRIAERALKIAVFSKQQDVALQAARRWVELAPGSLEAHYALAALALRTGNQGEALEHFDYLLSTTQSSIGEVDTWQQILSVLAQEPDQNLAQQLMGQLVERRPNDADACYAYARLAVHAESWPLAEQQLDRCLQLRPDWTAALILRAQLSHKQERSDEARKQLEAAVQRQPKDVELRLAYARLLVDLEAFGEARKQYRALLRQQPEDTQIIFSLALLALEENQLGEAREMFERLLALGFEPQQVYYYLGAIAEEQGDADQALEWYSNVEESDQWLEVQIRMARLEARGGDVDAARDRLRKARFSEPTQAQRLFLIEGDILSQIEWHEEAWTLYSQYLESQPEDIEILYARSLVAERLDRLDEAEADLRRVLEIEPDNTRALNALGYTLTDRTDRHQEALEYISRALAQSPDDPAIIDSMGWVLYRLGRLEEAQDYLQKAYALNPDVEIAAHLGEVTWMMGDREAARALWQKARKKAPGNPVLEDTVRRLSN
ncbi:MAG: tetratricopeptide repeat protein [Thiogranum sp.]|nr:tetratricopeptide repeat protein [Thiogranum sp.]